MIYTLFESVVLEAIIVKLPTKTRKYSYITRPPNKQVNGYCGWRVSTGFSCTSALVADSVRNIKSSQKSDANYSIPLTRRKSTARMTSKNRALFVNFFVLI